MSDESSGRSELDDLYAQLIALRAGMTDAERASLRLKLAALMDQPPGRTREQDPWLGSFQPGPMSAEGPATFKIGPFLPPRPHQLPREVLAELLDALAAAFAAMAKIVLIVDGAPPRRGRGGADAPDVAADDD
ncbi:MAG TPA: hypothetical protein VFT95_19620 [Micromonosporaceae bacterium]|nr:hypothetical protein [Micromonosporaceae bacterium]